MEFQNDNPMADFISQTINFEVMMNVPKKNATKIEIKGRNANSLVMGSDVPIIHIQTEIFSWLLRLPQLSKEYLTILGINPFKYSKKNIFFLFFRRRLGIEGEGRNRRNSGAY